MIHRLMKAKGSAANRGIGRVGDQCVAGRCSDAFANAIEDANGEKMPRSGGDSREWTNKGREPVAENDKSFSPAGAIGPGARPQAQQAGYRIGQPFDEP